MEKRKENFPLSTYQNCNENETDEDSRDKYEIDLLCLPWHDVLMCYLLPCLSWKDLFRLRRVSSAARSLVDDYFQVIRCIDLTSVSGQITPMAFHTISSDSRYINTLVLQNCKWLNNCMLQPVLERNSLLSCLDISGCSALTSVVLQVLANNCPLLKKLSLKNCHWVSATSIMCISMHCPCLEYVDLTSCWEVTDEAVCELAMQCPRLRHLSLSRIYGITDLTLSMLASYCPDLERLDVAGCWRITDYGIRLVGEYCLHLKTLLVGDCRDVTEACLATLRLRMYIDRPKLHFPYHIISSQRLSLQI